MQLGRGATTGGLWRLPKDACGRGLGLFAMVAAVLAVFAVPDLRQPVALASSAPVLNWTQQHPATSPPARVGAWMAYDAATGTVVLFGGVNSDATGGYNDTWTWAA